MSPRSFVLSVAVSVACALGAGAQTGAPTPPSSRPQDLIKTLQSDASKPEKALACKFLAVYGGKEAVPALGPLLTDPELASWARIPLEAIPDPSADAALREATSKVQGRLLVGVINSIGVRRDAKAVDTLAEKLHDADAAVASAAAIALGHIGGDRATEILEPTLTAANTPPAVRSAVAQGCVLCAEQFLAGNNAARATSLYDAVRKADVPKPRIIEATRGAMIARGPAGAIPILVELLRSSDKALVAVGLGVSRELPSNDVTAALISEFGRAEPALQSLLVVALADRNDSAVKPVILQAARGGAPAVRLAAIGVLDRWGDVSVLPVLVDAAASDDAELAQTARASLIRLPGKDVDAALVSRLREANGRERRVLIELVEQRKIEGGLPLFLASAKDADADVRTAAIDAVGAIGTDKQLPDLLQLLTATRDAGDRRVLERAISAIGGRWGAASVPQLVPLAKNTAGNVPADTRVVALHALAACGGAEALSTLRGATQDKDAAVQDEAVRTLSTWPNRWPEDASAADPLLDLARSGSRPAHRVLGVRGYLQYVQGDKKLSADKRVELVKAILPLVTRPDEKRLAIATLGGIPSPSSLQELTTLAADPALAEDACAAILRIAARSVGDIPTPARRSALQTVAERSKAPRTKERAQGALKELQE